MKRQIPMITSANDPALFGPAPRRRMTVSTRNVTIACLAAVALGLAGGAANAAPADKFVAGESTVIAGGTVSTCVQWSLSET